MNDIQIGHQSRTKFHSPVHMRLLCIAYRIHNCVAIIHRPVCLPLLAAMSIVSTSITRLCDGLQLAASVDDGQLNAKQKNEGLLS